RGSSRSTTTPWPCTTTSSPGSDARLTTTRSRSTVTTRVSPTRTRTLPRAGRARSCRSGYGRASAPRATRLSRHRLAEDSTRDADGQVRISRRQRREIATGRRIAPQHLLEERQRDLPPDLLLALTTDARPVAHAVVARASLEPDMVAGAAEPPDE